MTDSPFDYKSNDLGLVYVPPASETDPRVPMAEEFSLAEKIRMYLYAADRNEGWDQDQIPEITVASPRTITIKGALSSGVYPRKINIDTSLVLPALTQTGIFIGRDYLSIVSFAAEVGEYQDPVLGTVAFEYSVIGQTTINGIQKENARRLRAFWIIVSSPNPLTEANIWDSLTVVENAKTIAIAHKVNTGFLLGTTTTRIYALDPNLIISSYVVIKDSLKIAPVCSVRRSLNFQEDGYIYGYNVEDSLDSTDIQLLAERNTRGDTQNEIAKSVKEIITGRSRKGAIRKKAVLNFTTGQSSDNPSKPGIPANGLNGSLCLGNDQRIQFTNQKIIDRFFVTAVTANNDGSGRALASVGLNTNSPVGSFFSENRQDHKIYDLDGREQSDLGQFSNLGGNGSLQWKGKDNATILPGQTLFFAPAIRYPSGSGMSIPYLFISKAWKDGAAISTANIRDGKDSDISAYESPANNESFLVVYGSERVAIHYIYKKVSVTANTQGVISIPLTEKGCFAFVEGVTGRINKPVVSGLNPGLNYSALCYYPPRFNETWQFQVEYVAYQGQGILSPDFLQDSTISSEPMCFFHTSGGGLSVHQGDSDLARRPISLHLPAISTGVKAYEFDAPVSFPDEPYTNSAAWRENVKIFPAADLVYPTTGQKLTFEPGTGFLSKSIKGVLKSGGKKLGLKVPPINGGDSFQAVIAFTVKKNNRVMLVVATKNCAGNLPIDIAFDSSETAFDLFQI